MGWTARSTSLRDPPPRMVNVPSHPEPPDNLSYPDLRYGAKDGIDQAGARISFRGRRRAGPEKSSQPGGKRPRLVEKGPARVPEATLRAGGSTGRRLSASASLEGCCRCRRRPRPSPPSSRPAQRTARSPPPSAGTWRPSPARIAPPIMNPNDDEDVKMAL